MNLKKSGMQHKETINGKQKEVNKREIFRENTEHLQRTMVSIIVMGIEDHEISENKSNNYDSWYFKLEFYSQQKYLLRTRVKQTQAQRNKIWKFTSRPLFKQKENGYRKPEIQEGMIKRLVSGYNLKMA